MGITFGELVREYFPGASDEFVEWFIWSRTSYPCDKPDEEAIRSSLMAYKEAHDNGARLCEFCDTVAQIDGLCRTCHESLKGTTK